MKDEQLQQSMKKYNDQIVELNIYLVQIEYKETDDPNIICSRLSTMNGIISRATVLAAYFNAVYEKSFCVLKVKAKQHGERMADAYAKGEFADLGEIVQKADGLIKALDRISANYGKILEYRQAELMSGMGKREGNR